MTIDWDAARTAITRHEAEAEAHRARGENLELEADDEYRRARDCTARAAAIRALIPDEPDAAA